MNNNKKNDVKWILYLEINIFSEGIKKRLLSFTLIQFYSWSVMKYEIIVY